MAYRSDVKELQNISNVGPAMVRYLNSVGVHNPFELDGQNPYSMFDELCRVSGKQFDPCLLDVFISAVKFMEGAPAKEWWQYTEERKDHLRKNKAT